MRMLKVVGKVALLAVVLVVLGGCCAEQDKKIQSLTIMNRQLGKDMVEKEAQAARLEERVNSLDAQAKNFDTLIASKNDQIAGLTDQVRAIQASYDKLMDDYKTLAGTAASSGGARGPLNPRVVILLKALQEKYPTLFEFDEASGRLRFASDVTFDLGSDAVKAQATEALAKLAAILNDEAARKIRVDVIGHTCNTPIVKPETKARFGTNQVLSEARATAVKNILVQAGVGADRITTKGMGESQPLAPNTSAENKAKNRRVEIFLKD